MLGCLLSLAQLIHVRCPRFRRAVRRRDDADLSVTQASQIDIHFRFVAHVDAGELRGVFDVRGYLPKLLSVQRGFRRFVGEFSQVFRVE